MKCNKIVSYESFKILLLFFDLTKVSVKLLSSKSRKIKVHRYFVVKYFRNTRSIPIALFNPLIDQTRQS